MSLKGVNFHMSKSPFLLVLLALVVGASSCKTAKKVLVKKDSCQSVYDGALLECEVVEK